MNTTRQTDKEDKILTARAEDAKRKAENRYETCCVGFLNPHQRTMLSENAYLSTAGTDIVSEYNGGYPEAERTLLIFRYEYAEFSADDVIAVVHIYGRELDGLTHRDYLGSLMGLGVIRESIGDIVVCEDGAFVFVKHKIADYIIQNLAKIGRRGVKCEVCACSEAQLPQLKTVEKKGTVASARLDAVLAFAAGISRGRAAELIDKETVSVNFEIVTSQTMQLKEGDLLSVRGIGRIRVKEIGGLTRKGRIGITVLKYN